ncbi:isoprenyl transferase [Gorillibacterium timonense]|uniref:isoprenyl transferase n=1 Tax=Gorillibacterium timonense TaxID=1689269 RepID=UPI00071CE511|nr:isoprenyl transferase [Gorillibacterium timonense]
MVRLWKKSKIGSDKAPAIEQENVPEHVAVIMDGNGRWAKQRGLPRIAGHHAGMKAVKRVTIAADSIGVKALTMYAFSTENWNRPQEEVDYLMKLPSEFLAIELQELIEKNVQVRMTGWREGLPGHTLAALDQAEADTRHNTGLILNFALNYGSRREILEAVKAVAREAAEGQLSPDSITESHFAGKLLTAGMPDPDLLIRTSGELRLSNFMLWQSAYTEFWFSNRYWPEFGDEDFFEAIREYQHRTRRYGRLK